MNEPSITRAIGHATRGRRAGSPSYSPFTQMGLDGGCQIGSCRATYLLPPRQGVVGQAEQCEGQCAIPSFRPHVQMLQWVGPRGKGGETENSKQSHVARACFCEWEAGLPCRCMKADNPTGECGQPAKRTQLGE